MNKHFKWTFSLLDRPEYEGLVEVDQHIKDAIAFHIWFTKRYDNKIVLIPSDGNEIQIQISISPMNTAYINVLRYDWLSYVEIDPDAEIELDSFNFEDFEQLKIKIREKLT